jgi:hypothetical protein
VGGRFLAAAALLCAGCPFGPGPIAGTEPDAAVDAAPGAPDADVDAFVLPPGARRRLTFSGFPGGELTDFPLLVLLDDSRIDYGRTAPDGADVRFFGADGTPLAHEIEQWLPGGTSCLWVRVPRLDANTDYLWMIYGEAPAGGVNPQAVWDDAFEAVWHLGDSLASSAGTSFAGTAVGTALVGGRIADGRTFVSGGDHRISVADGGKLFDGWSQFTLEAWIAPAYGSDVDWEAAGDDALFDKGGGLTAGRLFRQSWQASGTGFFQIDVHLTGGRDLFRRVQIARGGWSWVVYSYDGESLRIYRDGAVTDEFAALGSLVANNDSFHMGHASDPIDGSLDEVRISTIARDAAWVSAQHLSMTDRLVVYGAQEE